MCIRDRVSTQSTWDGVILAEIFKYYFPKQVEMHNFPAAHSIEQKRENWNILNTKVLRKLGKNVNRNDIERVIHAEPQAAERVLWMEKNHMSRPLAHSDKMPSSLKPQENLWGIASLVGDSKMDFISPDKLDKGMFDEIDKELREENTKLNNLREKCKMLEKIIKAKDSTIQSLSLKVCLLYTSPSPRDLSTSRMPSSA
eukprot:TRINITY_DN13774_c0_g1_i2.p1 TRINITY_DN13774_c0_g1~~TRINITY_DN13774_c0_g1_i2.p1  ORF type:complete len:199 (-),score=41.23 TRINITY_DN13774_c0_g1_i2:80-676(-)